jgi:hypothetical protein
MVKVDWEMWACLDNSALSQPLDDNSINSQFVNFSFTTVKIITYNHFTLVIST